MAELLTAPCAARAAVITGSSSEPYSTVLRIVSIPRRIILSADPSNIVPMTQTAASSVGFEACPDIVLSRDTKRITPIRDAETEAASASWGSSSRMSACIISLSPSEKDSVSSGKYFCASPVTSGGVNSMAWTGIAKRHISNESIRTCFIYPSVSPV